MSKWLPDFNNITVLQPINERAEYRRQLAKKDAGIVTANDIQLADLKELNYLRQKQQWDKQDELPIAQEIVGDIAPGYSTYKFAKNASRDFGRAGLLLKQGYIRPALGYGLKGVGNIGFGVASLVPFTGILKHGLNNVSRVSKNASKKLVDFAEKQTNKRIVEEAPNYSLDNIQAKELFDIPEFETPTADLILTSRTYSALSDAFGMNYGNYHVSKIGNDWYKYVRENPTKFAKPGLGLTHHSPSRIGRDGLIRHPRREDIWFDPDPRNLGGISSRLKPNTIIYHIDGNENPELLDYMILNSPKHHLYIRTKEFNPNSKGIRSFRWGQNGWEEGSWTGSLPITVFLHGRYKSGGKLNYLNYFK